MFDDEPLVKLAYPIFAAFAGAITALAFKKWKEMAFAEIFLTVFVGASFAIFVAPWFAHVIIGSSDPRTVAAVTYLMAAGSHILLPVLIRRLQRQIDERDSQESEA